MEIILLERIQHLGDVGDLVKVRPGYARNYLIPKGKAVLATAAKKAEFEQHRKELEQAAQSKLESAQARAGQLNGVSVTISRLASEEGRLFGSVGTTDIAEAVSAVGMELAKSEIHLPEGPLKTLGTHVVALTLHPEVDVSITVNVVAEEGEAPAALEESDTESGEPAAAGDDD